ncbi:MAG TPA: glycosyltransferase, partial [Sphingomonas sp.]|nr:glycosyltransferase [Sphingomonas sp.]
EPARAMPELRFVVAGPQYPPDIDWSANVERIEHLPPSEHAAFYSASRFTLNVTRADMIAAGWSPSVRLFEAAACATPIISDIWPGLDQLFVPDEEIILAADGAAVASALARDDAGTIGIAAQHRVLAEHSAAIRAGELEAYLDEAMAATGADTLTTAA